MKKPRIAIAGFQHETNTFAPILTSLADFELGGAWPALTRGADVIDRFTPMNIPIGGFIQSASDMTLIPILWTAAEPAGYVSADAFNVISDVICQGIESAESIDGVYLDLHGAMVVDGYEDGEGELVKRIRHIIGDDLPLIVSLDLHGNLTPEFFEQTSAVTIYRTYPHIDMAQTGARACTLLRQQLANQAPFKKAFRQLDYLIPLPSQATMREPGRALYASLPDINDTAETLPLESADIALGFPPADIYHCGASIVAYGNDKQAVNAAADALLARLEQAETAFVNPMVDSPTAVAKARTISQGASKPVVIADPQDNPGAGATGDTTGLLRALVEGEAKDAYLGMIWDPDLAAKAHRAGIGAQFKAQIAGRYEPGGPPYQCLVEVEQLGDGEIAFTGPMYGGSHARLGPMCLIRIVDEASDVHVIVSTQRTQNADQEIYRHLGIEPSKHAILVVKSSAHFLADYEPIAQCVIFAEAAGANPCRLDVVRYKNLRANIRQGPDGPVL